VKETEFTLNADVVIAALGQEVAIEAKSAGVKLTGWGTIECDKNSLATSVKGVFAGGDAVTGANNLISAIAAGKRAAVSIDRMLAGKLAVYAREPEPVAVTEEVVLKRVGNLPRRGRAPLDVEAPDKRRKGFGEYVATMTEDEARSEAARCLNCGCGVACGVCYRVCMSMAIKEVDGRYVIDREKCHACGMCFQRCPNKNIEMVRS
jgi:NAD-dependent dihydropyrimidine dehydrogenase PreA subunit